jgi:PTH1 family peptidyl-tRNA hydrolase
MLSRMIRLIAGLGNPGARYRHTPHNVGQDIVDILAERHGGQFRADRRFKGELAEVRIADQPVTLVIPTTYMNLSGQCVVPAANYRNLEPEEILIVCDDADIPMGRIRFRKQGSHGGQKGLLSVIQTLGTNEFPRLRIGIDPGEPIHDLTQYVLTPMWGEVREEMQHVCERAADAIERAVETDIGTAMNEFNGVDFLSIE